MNIISPRTTMFRTNLIIINIIASYFFCRFINVMIFKSYNYYTIDGIISTVLIHKRRKLTLKRIFSLLHKFINTTMSSCLQYFVLQPFLFWFVSFFMGICLTKTPLLYFVKMPQMYLAKKLQVNVALQTHLSLFRS